MATSQQGPPQRRVETTLLEKLSDLVDIATNFGLEFCKTPLSKSIALVLGDQSSGKSSLINHLFNTEIRIVGANAVDTAFTIIETVPEDEFEQLCGSNYRGQGVTLTPEQLSQPITRSHTDERKHVLWTELLEGEKMSRYRQFYESHLRNVFTRHRELIKAIVINEKYVFGTELERRRFKERQEREREKKRQAQLQQRSQLQQQQQHWGEQLVLEDDYFTVEPEVDRPMIKDLIIIDSPGFNDDSFNGDPVRFQANVDVLTYFFTQCDVCLFLVSTDHMLSLSMSLHLLQLTLLDPETKNYVYEQAARENWGVFGADKEKKTSSLLETLVSGAYSMVETRIKRAANYAAGAVASVTGMNASTNARSSKYYGSSMYDKLYFVINKIDLAERPEYAFFEFGCSIGRRFQHLPLPTVTHCLGIGIPAQQRKHRRNPHAPLEQLKLGHLEELEHILEALKEDTQGRIMTQLSYVMDKITEVYDKSSYYSRYMNKGHFERAKQISKLVGLVDVPNNAGTEPRTADHEPQRTNVTLPTQPEGAPDKGGV